MWISAAVCCCAHCADMSDDAIDPAFLRQRAEYYRELADQEPRREIAVAYRRLAAALDMDAEARERQGQILH